MMYVVSRPSTYSWPQQPAWKDGEEEDLPEIPDASDSGAYSSCSGLGMAVMQKLTVMCMHLSDCLRFLALEALFA